MLQDNGSGGANRVAQAVAAVYQTLTNPRHDGIELGHGVIQACHSLANSLSGRVAVIASPLQFINLPAGRQQHERDDFGALQRQ